MGTADDRVVSSQLDLAVLSQQFSIPAALLGEDGVVMIGNIRHTYLGGRLISSTNTLTGETIGYVYNSDGTQVTLQISNGMKATVTLGAGGSLGSGLVQASVGVYDVEKDELGRVIKITDYEKGVETLYQYAPDGTARITTRGMLGGRLISETHLKMGADNRIGGTDDVYLSATGFQNGNFFSETFDAQGRLLSSDAWEKVFKRDGNGRLLREDGSFAMTEAEAAFSLERRLTAYIYNEAAIS